MVDLIRSHNAISNYNVVTGDDFKDEAIYLTKCPEKSNVTRNTSDIEQLTQSVNQLEEQVSTVDENTSDIEQLFQTTNQLEEQIVTVGETSLPLSGGTMQGNITMNFDPSQHDGVSYPAGIDELSRTAPSQNPEYSAAQSVITEENYSTSTGSLSWYTDREATTDAGGGPGNGLFLNTGSTSYGLRLQVPKNFYCTGYRIHCGFHEDRSKGWITLMKMAVETTTITNNGNDDSSSNTVTTVIEEGLTPAENSPQYEAFFSGPDFFYDTTLSTPIYYNEDSDITEAFVIFCPLRYSGRGLGGLKCDLLGYPIPFTPATNRITHLLHPVNENEPATKKYVDDEINKLITSTRSETNVLSTVVGQLLERLASHEERLRTLTA